MLGVLFGCLDVDVCVSYVRVCVCVCALCGVDKLVYNVYVCVVSLSSYSSSSCALEDALLSDSSHQHHNPLTHIHITHPKNNHGCFALSLLFALYLLALWRGGTKDAR